MKPLPWVKVQLKAIYEPKNFTFFFITTTDLKKLFVILSLSVQSICFV